MGGHFFSWPLWSFLQLLPLWNTPQPLHENESFLDGQASPLHGGSATWLPCDPLHAPSQEEPCISPHQQAKAGCSSAWFPLAALLWSRQSFPFPHAREGGWASPLHKQMANQCEKVPKTNLASRRQALGAVFTYGGKTHGICPHPGILLVSFSVLSSVPGLIYILNEVGWFLINPEGLSWSSFISLWLIFVLSFKSSKSPFKYPVTLTITYLIYIFLWDPVQYSLLISFTLFLLELLWMISMLMGRGFNSQEENTDCSIGDDTVWARL